MKDTSGLMRQYPQLLGIGIDEATALVVTGHTAEVVGKSKVAFFDYRSGPPAGEKDYLEVPAGGHYDLKARRLLPRAPEAARRASGSRVSSMDAAPAGWARR